MKEILTQKDVEEIISNQLQESTYLEFKRGDVFKSTDKKDISIEISKDVSAFANSDGGIIIYGIEEKNHIASSIVPVDATLCSKERLEQIIDSNIQRRIPGLKIHPIICHDDPNQLIYVVNIPRSYEAPHMSKDMLYYKRYNFMVQRMQEYEIRDCYLRPNLTQLKLSVKIIPITSSQRLAHGQTLVKVHFDFHIFITNHSTHLEKYYKLQLISPIRELFFVPEDDLNNAKSIKESTQEDTVWSFYFNDPLFPNENFLSLKFHINECVWDQHLHKKIELILYYSNGINKHEISVQELILLRNQEIKNL